MSSVIRRNVVANFAGNAWSALLGLAFTAFYFRMLGPENFGLVSVSLLLQTLAQVFDLGLSGTITRELARTSSSDSKGENPVLILNTLGVLNLSFALACTLLFVLTAPWIATSWLNANQLSSETIRACLRWMGISFVLQSIANFYSAGLSGLQRQVVLNALNAGFLTARHLTAACCLIFVAPSIELFFIAQVPVLVLQAGVSAAVLYRRIAGQGRSQVFDRGILRSCWQFSAAFAGTNITSLFVSQLDRIVLSKTLSLDQFGLYGLASSLALNLLRMVQPVYAAFYPRFTQMVAAGRGRELTSLYARGCGLVGLLVFPAAAVLVVLASPVLSFFTGSPNVSDSAQIVLIILALGTAVGACNQLPYALQQANGNQTFALRLNLLYLAVYSPILFFLSIGYGAVGASVGVLILNLANFICFPVYSARTYLDGALAGFYLNTFLFPITLAFAPMLALSAMLPEPTSKFVLIATCLGAALVSYGSVGAGFLLKSRLSGRPVFG